MVIKKGVNSKSSPNNISQILPKFTNINVSLGKFVYRHNNSSEVYSCKFNLEVQLRSVFSMKKPLRVCPAAGVHSP